jgi:sugar phosphate isomerase/epimerase
METTRIRIGNQTSIHAEGVMLPFDFALRNGFDAFEWFSDKGRQGWCEPDMDATTRRRLRQTGVEHDIRYTVHAPHWAATFNADGSAAIRQSIECAGDLGAAVVNIHLFTEHGPQGFVQALAPLLERAREVGVQISIENTPQTTPDDFNAAFAGLAKLPEAATGWVGMCLDMGHANLCQATRNDYLGFVDRLGLHVPIIHWHAHENWGDHDSHLTLFTGPSAQNDAGVRGLVQRIWRRGFCGSVVLEQWPHPPEMLLQARDRLRGLITAQT